MAVITKKEVRVDNGFNKIAKKSAEIGKFLKKVLGFVYKIIRNTFVFIFYRKSDSKTYVHNNARNISQAEIRQQASNNLRFIR
ncbi:MAG: hypothetical protein ACW981_07885 [Candidatus Hodarchaeales archaeon]|jgi:hypothetical protein